MADDPTLVALAEELLALTTRIAAAAAIPGVAEHHDQSNVLVTRIGLIYEYMHPDPECGYHLAVMDHPTQPQWQIAALLEGARKIIWGG